MFLTLALLSTLAAQTPAAAVDVDDDDQPIKRLAATAAEQRLAVDAVADDLDAIRAAAREEAAALKRRLQTLRHELEDERLTLQTLRTVGADLAARDVADRAAVTEARAPIVASARALQEAQRALPFRVVSRTARVDAVLVALEQQPIEAAAAALWVIVLDEALLLDRVERVRQRVTVKGVDVLADVVHVGPLTCFRTKDGTVGVADGEVWRVIDSSEGRQRLGLFFDAFKRGGAAGAFLLPLPTHFVTTPGATP